MPIKQGKEGVRQEMHKFKQGELHSGSKKGPVVKKRSQAIAIALHQSGLSKESVESFKDKVKKIIFERLIESNIEKQKAKLNALVAKGQQKKSDIDTAKSELSKLVNMGKRKMHDEHGIRLPTGHGMPQVNHGPEVGKEGGTTKYGGEPTSNPTPLLKPKEGPTHKAPLYPKHDRFNGQVFPVGTPTGDKEPESTELPTKQLAVNSPSFAERRLQHMKNILKSGQNPGGRHSNHKKIKPGVFKATATLNKKLASTGKQLPPVTNSTPDHKLDADEFNVSPQEVAKNYATVSGRKLAGAKAPAISVSNPSKPEPSPTFFKKVRDTFASRQPFAGKPSKKMLTNLIMNTKSFGDAWRAGEIPDADKMKVTAPLNNLKAKNLAAFRKKNPNAAHVTPTITVDKPELVARSNTDFYNNLMTHSQNNPDFVKNSPAKAPRVSRDPQVMKNKEAQRAAADKKGIAVNRGFAGIEKHDPEATPSAQVTPESDRLQRIRKILRARQNAIGSKAKGFHAFESIQPKK